MSRPSHLQVVAATESERERVYGAPPDQPVGDILRTGGYLLRRPQDTRLLPLLVREVDVEVTLLSDLPPGTEVFTLGTSLPAAADPADPSAGSAATTTRTSGQTARPGSPTGHPPAADGHSRDEPFATWPEEITDRRAVEVAYTPEIEQVGSFLRRGLSALVVCDKLVVEHLVPLIVERSGGKGVLLQLLEEEQEPQTALGIQRSPRQRRLEELRQRLRELKSDEFLVIPHLDLLTAGAEPQLPPETRDLVELVYDHSGRLLLAFADPSLSVPSVVAERFAARISIAGSPRTVVDPVRHETRLLGEVLVTRAEAQLFQGFSAKDFHKHVAGLNPVRLRQAMRYAHAEHQARASATHADLRSTIRGFKAQMSATFEVPDVTFEQIGGYDEVKDAIRDALEIMGGLHELPEGEDKLQSELMPRGFIFWGPPGTGKTLFAKAIANRLEATIMVISGPEVTDKYVGEGERKIRELFAAARRNAPSVIVFDEFDAIAGRRSERDDGGSRAGNAMVAQLLTELDGFREDVPFLVIGTTNRLSLIDPAMLRPSRFRPIRIGLPKLEARREIIRVHAQRFKIQIGEELLELIAGATENRCGDDIQSIFRDAFVGANLRKIPADARRLGELVGQLNRAVREQREGVVAT